jgi:hypothetical protein
MLESAMKFNQSFPILEQTIVFQSQHTLFPTNTLNILNILITDTNNHAFNCLFVCRLNFLVQYIMTNNLVKQKRRLM